MAQVSEVLVPDIGDFSDVPIVELLVSPGDTVAEEDPLVVIESDKATMEVPAPFAGTVGELKVAVGDTVSEGSVLLTLQTENGDAPAQAEAAQVSTPNGDAAAPEAVASGIVAEAQSAPEGGNGAPDTHQGSGSDGSGATGSDAPQASAPGELAEENLASGAPETPVHASPIARRMARELGVDLGSLTGSGPRGRITKQDVQAAADGGGASAGAPAPEAAPAPAEETAPAPVAAKSVPVGDGERVPLSRIQRLSAENLSRAWQTIPHVTHHEDADITDLEAFRKELNAEQQDVKVTMVALLLKATTASLRRFPRFASSLDGDELVIKSERHLGFAADTPNGLVVPVIRDVDRKGLLEVAGELTELSGKARAGKLGPKEMSGAVFTISSLGGIGGTGFTPIVNPPQVAILGVVRSSQKPVWDGTQFVPRLILPLSLSYDHRVIDGAAAARFCADLAKVLSDVRRFLL
jgi:pyruvate dehydrogenase E2 component (dihydrolipoamide acetyltransferase)